MTKPRTLTRAFLLQGCAPLALSITAVALPTTAHAQGVNATPTVAQGTVAIDRATPGVDTLTVTGNNAIVDWAPTTISGVPLTFLPDGNSLIFRGNPGDPNFAILNRILPTAITSPAEFAGTVQSFVQPTVGGPSNPGGFVAFYSPTGILVSGTAVFQVPQLVLSTNDIDDASFTDFVNGAGPMLFSGSPSQIQIQAGATLTGTPEGSYFIVSSSNIDMDGDAYFNGSTRYVAGTQLRAVRHHYHWWHRRHGCSAYRQHGRPFVHWPW